MLQIIWITVSDESKNSSCHSNFQFNASKDIKQKPTEGKSNHDKFAPPAGAVASYNTLKQELINIFNGDITPVEHDMGVGKHKGLDDPPAYCLSTTKRSTSMTFQPLEKNC